MLSSYIWVLMTGFFAGQLVSKLKLPPLVGMILAGIAIGPYGLDLLSSEFLMQASGLQTIAVMVILAKAGLGLDREKLRQQGAVALRLGFLPAICEAIVIAIASQFFFQLDWAIGLLLGCVLAAESPAVIVPGMLWLKQKGWGVHKGIPDAILTGSALSDVLVLLVFNLVLSQLMLTSQVLNWGGFAFDPALLLLMQVFLQVCGGIILGLVAASGLNIVLKSKTWIINATQATLVTACIALALVLLATELPIYSGYLAVMTLGFRISDHNPPQARRLRQGFNTLWAIAQIILFALLGASVQLNVLGQSLLPGLALLGVGTLLGRGLGWTLSTLGSNWTLQERLYLLPGNSAKATVQAAIGGIPLAAGVPGGEIILALSALSILITAPLGAWAIPFFAHRLLQQDEVDPTKVLQEHQLHFLVGIYQATDASSILNYAAHLARSSDGIISLVSLDSDEISLLTFKRQAHRILADIPYQWESNAAVSMDESMADLMRVAQRLKVDQVIVSATEMHQARLDGSSIPIVLVPNVTL